jgi:hypothetical protein
MTRLIKILFILSGLILVTSGEIIAQSSNPVSATGHVFAEIIPIFTASETSQLNFGRFSPGIQGGKIILSPESTVSVLGTVYQGVGSHNAASFSVSGDADATFSITLPSSPVVLTHTSEAKIMLVDDWVSVPFKGIGTGVLKNGFQEVYVGATLKVGTLNDNPVGVYLGKYFITFDFN